MPRPAVQVLTCKAGDDLRRIYVAPPVDACFFQAQMMKTFSATDFDEKIYILVSVVKQYRKIFLNTK
jgi:hypothetical protein